TAPSGARASPSSGPSLLGPSLPGPSLLGPSRRPASPAPPSGTRWAQAGESMRVNSHAPVVRLQVPVWHASGGGHTIAARDSQMPPLHRSAPLHLSPSSQSVSSGSIGFE